MTGDLGMSAPLSSPVALAEKSNDQVIKKMEKKKKKKKKKAKHSHAVEPETEAQSEDGAPVTPTEVARSYTPILPPVSPFARKRMAEAQISKAENTSLILPLRFTPSASNEADKAAPAATSGTAND